MENSFGFSAQQIEALLGTANSLSFSLSLSSLHLLFPLFLSHSLPSLSTFSVFCPPINPPSPDSIFFLDLTFCPICSTLAPYCPWAPNQRKPEGKENEASCHLSCHLPSNSRDYKHTLNSSSWKSRLEAILCRVPPQGSDPPWCWHHASPLLRAPPRTSYSLPRRRLCL